MRLDYVPSEEDRVTTTLDFYHHSFFDIFTEEAFEAEETDLFRPGSASGGFVMSQWNHKFNDDRDFNVRGYYDRTNRSWIGGIEKQDTFELDVRHRNQLNSWRERVVGLTGRYSVGRFYGPDLEADFDVFPAAITINDPYVQYDRLDTSYIGGFVQEKWTLVDETWFAWLGTKVGYNNFNGVNAQPSIRSLLVLDEETVLWGAVSRAVRLPTRFDAGVITAPPALSFDPVVRTPRDLLINEEVIAYELGLRRQPSDRFSWEASLFYNQYENLVEEGPIASIFPGFDLSRSNGTSYGAELNGNLELDPAWNLTGGFSYINLEIDPDPDEFLFTHLRQFYTPRHMAFLQSQAQITPRLQWDVTLRYNDNLPDAGFVGGGVINPSISSYFQLDTRLNYQLSDSLDFTIVGRNLLDSDQKEFHTDDIFFAQTRTNSIRSVYAQLTWKTGRRPSKRFEKKPIATNEPPGRRSTYR